MTIELHQRIRKEAAASLARARKIHQSLKLVQASKRPPREMRMAEEISRAHNRHKFVARAPLVAKEVPPPPILPTGSR